ncbi:MAG: P-loop NTPase [Rhodovarius sp.]|nr:P-loop NTPase [Rhodovarius sp.]MCX7931953.1 P-loop NTPase [Rhodovarius sp.]MDW8315021.1 P-loop NTPase [Rhodovarius sp.]
MAPSDTATREGPPPLLGDRPGLIAFVTDDTSEAAIRNALAPFEPDLQIRRGDVRLATRTFAREPTPDALIVDVEGVADAYAALDALAQVCTPDMRVLVIGDRTDMGFYRELTQRLGVSEYIYKPLTRDNVTQLFAPHLRGATGRARITPARSGRITCVLGAHGGVGASVVAVNLALAVADNSRGHVALLDLNLRGGATALMLGAQASAGLRIALEEPARVDALFLERVAVEIEPRFRLIAAEEPLDADPNPTPEGITRVLSLLQERFNHIVIDLPRPLGPRERQVLTAARSSVIVATPDVVAIRDTVALRRIVGGLARGAAVMTALNRDGEPGTMKRALVEEGLGAPPDAVIPYLPKLLPRSVNLGRPAVRESSVLRRALAPLVREISGAEPLPAAAFWHRLFGARR